MGPARLPPGGRRGAAGEARGWGGGDGDGPGGRHGGGAGRAAGAPAPETAGALEVAGGRFPLLAPLRGRDFALLWGGNAVSLAGDQLQAVALAVFALALTESPAVLGLLLAVQAVPRAVLMLLGGVLADRYHPRTLLVATNTLQGGLVAAVAVVLAADRLTLGHLVAYAAASGVVYAASVPAAPALVPQLVPRARLRAATALTSLNFNLAVAVYAPLGGLLVARAGPGPAFAFNALSFFVAAGAVWLVRAPGARGPGPRAPGGPGPLTQLRAGVALARANPVVWTAILAATGYSLGATGATLVGVPALAALDLGAGSAGVGLLYGALGLGATAGTVALGSLRGLRHPGLWGGLTLLGLGLALASTAAAPTAAWAAAALALAGLLRGAGANIYITLVQAHAPDAARGRVMGLFMLGVMGLAPLSMAAGGLVGSILGPRALLAGGGLVVAAAGAFALSRRPFREAA